MTTLRSGWRNIDAFIFITPPTSSFWLNLVERWFRELTQKRLRRGNFTGVSELVAAIKDYLAQNNKQPKPFVWTATAQQIIEKVNRCKGISETLH